MNDIIYFELNNWFPDRDYPNAEPFKTWMNDYVLKFRDIEWVKENRLCVVAGNVDMSSNYCITATKEWVENNCPDLLTLYTKFIRIPYEDGEVEGRFGAPFKEYNEDNIGVHYWDYDNACYEDYPIFVNKNEDVNNKIKHYSENMQRVVEVYNLSINLESQLEAHRVWNI